MISKKTSLLIPSQLPEFIRDDPNYSTFVLFLQAYYEWMEEQGGAVYGSKNLTNYYDIDKTLDSFLDYYKTEFLNLFPQGSLVDQRKLIKHSKEIFGTKGTPQSFKFLFKVLYGSDVEIFNTKDFVFRASDGKWIVTKTIQLNSIDPLWKLAVGYKVFGTQSFGYATIQSVTQDNLFTTLVLSDVTKAFVSGEKVKIVDSLNKPVLIENTSLTAVIVGLVNSVEINTAYRGTGYSVNDPVVFYGGLDPNVAVPIGANAYISSVTTSTMNGILRVKGGTGYTTAANTDVNISAPVSGVQASAVLKSVDSNNYVVTWVTTDTIQDPDYPNRENITLNSTFSFPNTGITNANVALSIVLSHATLNTYGVNAFTMVNPGLGYTDATTTIDVLGKYIATDDTKKTFASLGMLSPINIVNPGINYNIGETIIFTGGSGFGAYANVTNVDSTTKGILSVEYFGDANTVLPLGGMGYRLDGLPTLSINTVSGSGAVLTVTGLVGDDAIVTPDLEPAGKISSIRLTETGQNYIARPNVSLRILDLLVYNNNPNDSVQTGDRLIQTTNDLPTGNTTFFANVDSVSVYTSNTDAYATTYKVRLYNYSSDNINTSANLIVVRSNELIGSNLRVNTANVDIYTSGKKIYGNGLARATVKLLQGVQIGNGIFLNSDGQPSGSSILQDEDYNEYTYFLKVNEALTKYKDTALSFLHPSGTHYKTYNKLDNDVGFDITTSSQSIPFTSLSSLLGVYLYTANIANTNFSNTIVFTGLSGVNIANVVLPNSFVTFYTPYGQPFTSKVVGTNYANTLVLEDNWITSVPNVAFGQSIVGTNTINILETTNAWTIGTGNSFNYLSDFININDNITYDGNTSNVVYVSQQSRTPSINLYNITLANANGYITVTRNVVTSNVWVAGNVAVAELVQIQTESGNVMTSEISDILILG